MKGVDDRLQEFLKVRDYSVAMSLTHACMHTRAADAH